VTAAAVLAPRPAPSPVAESPAMREALLAAHDVAPTPTTVLILGESGAGKEILAREIHGRSQRAAGSFVVLHCAAADRAEGELLAGPGGPFSRAAGGTLLLDEVSELSPAAQARLLRLLQERESSPPGAAEARVIATSHHDLPALVESGRFRSDLYYRLNVFPIALPPLRARPEDLLPLAEGLLAEAAEAAGIAPPALGPGARAALVAHPFPGNVRELRNLVERAVVRSRGLAVEPHHLGLTAPPALEAAPSGERLPDGLPLDLGRLERLAIEEALRRVQGNRTHAARLLGIGLRTLRNKLRTWREAGDPCEAGARQITPGPGGPGPIPAGLAARLWARRSQMERA